MGEAWHCAPTVEGGAGGVRSTRRRAQLYCRGERRAPDAIAKGSVDRLVGRPGGGGERSGAMVGLLLLLRHRSAESFDSSLMRCVDLQSLVQLSVSQRQLWRFFAAAGGAKCHTRVRARRPLIQGLFRGDCSLVPMPTVSKRTCVPRQNSGRPVGSAVPTRLLPSTVISTCPPASQRRLQLAVFLISATAASFDQMAQESASGELVVGIVDGRDDNSCIARHSQPLVGWCCDLMGDGRVCPIFVGND